MECRSSSSDFCGSLPPNMKVVFINIFVFCITVMKLTGQLTSPFLADGRVHLYSSWQVPVHEHRVSQSPPASLLTRPCFVYDRTKLLSVKPASLSPSLVPHLRDLGIGYHLSSRRSCRGGRGRQRPIKVVSLSSQICLSSNTENRPRPLHLVRASTVNQNNLTIIPLSKKTDSLSIKSLKVGTFNAQSLGPTCQDKRVAIYDFILENDLDILLIQETWFKEKGDESKCAEIAPPHYITKSFPRSHHGGGLAIVFKTSLSGYLKIVSSFSFSQVI